MVRTGERSAFKWKFRRFWLDIETVSGNFKARFKASAHPYAYLLSGKDDDNIYGFCQFVYMVSHLLTTDQQFADEVGAAIMKMDKEQKAPEENKAEEEAALQEVKGVQEFVEKPAKERRKIERDVNGRFKKAMKEAAKNEA